MKRNLLLTLALMLLGGVNLYAAPANDVEDIPGGKKYTLTDLSSAEASAAQADPNAVIIDVTGVTATYIEMLRSNPNCIFIVKDGTEIKLRNNPEEVLQGDPQNVCVNGVIASLVLQDEHPFACPAGAKATVAQYSRTQPKAFGTICLPFTVSDTDVEYYTTNGVRKSDGALLLKKSEAVPAGTPVIVYNPRHDNTHNYILNAEDVQLNPDAGEDSDGEGVKLVGVFEQQVIDVTKDTSNKYYYIASGAFWHATGTLTVNPFRAYLTSTTPLTPLGAKLRLQFGDEETTAIETLTGENNAVEAIYNANGVLQNGLQKGLNIVKMQNGKTVKVIVK